MEKAQCKGREVGRGVSQPGGRRGEGEPQEINLLVA